MFSSRFLKNIYRRLTDYTEIRPFIYAGPVGSGWRHSLLPQERSWLRWLFDLPYTCIVDVPLILSNVWISWVQNEIDLLSNIRHHNIIALLGYCIHGDTRFLVYELMENGCLETQLHGNISEHSQSYVVWGSWLMSNTGICLSYVTRTLYTSRTCVWSLMLGYCYVTLILH